jgi:hypothetical protein
VDATDEIVAPTVDKLQAARHSKSRFCAPLMAAESNASPQQQSLSSCADHKALTLSQLHVYTHSVAAVAGLVYNNAELVDNTPTPLPCLARCTDTPFAVCENCGWT